MSADPQPMNGAQSLVRTLVASGVELCFANPGTSEMHFVAALDQIDGMRCVLGLFEGVVTGAADGYYRMADKPAATLLHLGPGLGNGLANLHNAKKAGSGIVNIVGEHASHHLEHDAPLTADIEGIARPMSHWVHTARSSTTVARDGAAAVAQARTPPGPHRHVDPAGRYRLGPGRGRRAGAAAARAQRGGIRRRRSRSAGTAARPWRRTAARRHGSARTGAAAGRAHQREDGLHACCSKTTCRACSAAPAGCAPGAFRMSSTRRLKALKGVGELVLVGAKVPVAFFGYPGKPSVLIPPPCEVTPLAAVEDDIVGALEALAERLGARQLAPAHVAALERRGADALPTGTITPDGIGAVLAALLPENAIVVDESVSVGRNFGPLTAGAAPHDWLNLMGGSIGFALPAATGAAIAAPDRQVIVLEGDGSAMYTLQALWTMRARRPEREGADPGQPLVPDPARRICPRRRRHARPARQRHAHAGPPCAGLGGAGQGARRACRARG